MFFFKIDVEIEHKKSFSNSAIFETFKWQGKGNKKFKTFLWALKLRKNGNEWEREKKGGGKTFEKVSWVN